MGAWRALWASWAACGLSSGVGAGRPLSCLCGAVADRGAVLLPVWDRAGACPPGACPPGACPPVQRGPLSGAVARLLVCVGAMLPRGRSVDLYSVGGAGRRLVGCSVAGGVSAAWDRAAGGSRVRCCVGALQASRRPLLRGRAAYAVGVNLCRFPASLV